VKGEGEGVNIIIQDGIFCLPPTRPFVPETGQSMYNIPSCNLAAFAIRVYIITL
jgi:hypothetical protein